MHDDYDRRYMDALRALTAWRELLTRHTAARIVVASGGASAPHSR